MSLDQITVLNGLPVFSGNAKPGETSFTSDVDARTFLRSLENHFGNHDVFDDNKKIQIMFSRIHKTKGDAIRFISCYTDRPKLTFNELKTRLLLSYPSYKHTEFKPAARALLATKLTTTNMFCEMTGLENSSRAAAEAYVNNIKLAKNNFDADTILATGRTNIAGVTIPVDTVASEPTTSRPPPPPPPPSSSSIPTILLTETLQNFAMHLFLATQTHTKVYEKLIGEGPENCNTLLMAHTIDAFEKFKMTHAFKKEEKKKEEAIWKLEQSPIQNRYARRSMPQPRDTRDTRDAWTPNGGRNATQCYNCKQDGHMRKDCKMCSFCKRYGHTAKGCAERISKSKGKYCHECSLADSHNTDECFKKLNSSQAKNSNKNVRLATEEEYSSELYNSSSTESGDEPSEEY